LNWYEKLSFQKFPFFITLGHSRTARQFGGSNEAAVTVNALLSEVLALFYP